MMIAATYQKTGPADAVLTVGPQPTPVAAPGEVLVRLRASGINPADVKRRAGWNGSTMAHPLVIPHCDGAGVIEAVGDGVLQARIGERVWLWNAQGGYGTAGRAFGTAAEYIALPSAQAVPLADGVSFDEGACLGVPAVTAWMAVMCDGPIKGKTIFIQGAAGAVGHMAAQIALAHGARVIGSVSHEKGAAHARTAGNVEVVTRGENLAREVRDLTGGAGVERIIEVDLAANMHADIACLAANGVIAAYSCSSNPTPTLPYYDLANLGATIRFIQGFLLPEVLRKQAEASVNLLTANGTLRPAIGARFPLADISLAHERVEARALGQTVLSL